MTEIILQAYHVLDEIRKDQKYIEIKYLDQKMLELYDLEIKLFQQTKLAFDKVMQEGGIYHPDYKDLHQLNLFDHVFYLQFCQFYSF